MSPTIFTPGVTQNNVNGKLLGRYYPIMNKILTIVIFPIIIIPVPVFSVLFSILILIGIIAAIIVLRLVQIIFILVLLVFLILLLLSTKSPNIIEPHHTLLDVGGALLHHGKHQIILAWTKSQNALPRVHS